MKLTIVLCVVVAVVAVAAGAAVPQAAIRYQNDNVELLKYENDNIGLGNYRYLFEQTDGTQQEQQGQIINEGREDESIAVKGSYSWVGPDGVLYRVTYVADQNGFQPEIEEGPGGAVPPAVVASLLG